MKKFFSDPREASARITYIITANESPVRKGTVKVSNKEASQILVENLKVNERIARGWLTGAFNDYPMTVENFRKFVRRYAGKSGLESDEKANELAALLYGPGYEIRIADLDVKILFTNNQPGRFLVEKVCAYYNITGNEYQTLEQRDIYQHNHPVDFILEAAYDRLGDVEQIAFAKIGALPTLATYSRYCFKFLWEFTEEQTNTLLQKFVQVGLVIETSGEIKIDKPVLDFARRKLVDLSPRIRLKTQWWWLRVIQTQEYKKEFSNIVASQYLSSNATLRKRRRTLDLQQRSIEHVALGLFKVLFVLGYTPDWVELEYYFRYMNSAQYLEASYIRLQFTRDFTLNFYLLVLLSLATWFWDKSGLFWLLPLTGVFIVGFLFMYNGLTTFKKYESIFINLWEQVLQKEKESAK